MSLRDSMQIVSGLALAALLLLASACGGGDEATVPPIENTIISDNNSVDPLVIDGPTQYEGNQKPEAPLLPVPGSAPVDIFGSWNFGTSIFSVPLDTNGAGHVVTNGFSPGQQVAFIIVNLNPAYRDAHRQADGFFPLLPESSFSVIADLVQKGVSTTSLSEIQESTLADLGSYDDYSGMEYTGQVEPPQRIYEREAFAQGTIPYAAVPPVKTTSAIQKGEIRSFIYVAPRPSWPEKPIPPDPEDPDQDTSELDWPTAYNCQSGRLTTIGAHCLVFLSTDINNGHPDTIQFTEARLHRLALEFDTNIFPKATVAFGAVQSYREEGIWKNVDRYPIPPITGADYDQAEFTRTLPGEPDLDIENEQKIIIFLMNAEAGGFFVGAQRTAEAEYGEPFSVGSSIYIGSDNFPANDDAWEAGYSVMAHEFQHKLYNDHGMPSRPVVNNGGNYNWFNEGMSQLDIHVCGYTVNSGRIIDWAIDGQLTSYLENVNRSAVCMDGNTQFPGMQQTQYGNGFLFFLYLYEHYDEGIGRKIYQKAALGESDYIKLIEHVTKEPFDLTYTKFGIANFIDGIYKDNEVTDLFDSRFIYNTIDLRGTVNLATGTIVLPGVRTDVFPEAGGYPVQSIDRRIIPYGFDYFVFSNGDGRDLDITLYSDPYVKMYMLPVAFDPVLGKVNISPGVNLNY
jgi:hypothetical protein